MDKFKALVHKVIAYCDEPEKLGAIRLNKILWYSDVEAYRLTGNSITGARYVRRKKGPVPANVLHSLKELEEDRLISVKHPTAAYQPRLFTSLADPSADSESLFSDVETQIVKFYTKEICEKFTADEISEATHDDVWRAAEEGEEIPLAATLVSDSGDFRPEVLAWANSVMEKLDEGKQVENVV